MPNYHGKWTNRDGTPGIALPAPAPGNLEALQAFVNTSRPAKKNDELSTPRDLARWLSSHGLLPARTRLTEEDLLRAVGVREALFNLLRAVQGSQQRQDAIRALDRAMEQVRYQVCFDDVGPVGYEPSAEALDNALGALVDTLVVARYNGDWPRVKVCARDVCGRVYYDTSVNLVGKWCSRRCGTAVRSRTFRKKAKHRGL